MIRLTVCVKIMGNMEAGRADRNVGGVWYNSKTISIELISTAYPFECARDHLRCTWPNTFIVMTIILMAMMAFEIAML